MTFPNRRLRHHQRCLPSRCEHDAVLLEDFDSLWCAWHVGAFCNGHDLVVNEHLCLSTVDFVLCCAWKGNIDVDAPQSVGGRFRCGCGEGCAAEFSCVFRDTSTSVVLEVHDPSEFGSVDAFGVVNETTGIGHGYWLATKVEDLFACELSDVSGTRNGDSSTFERLPCAPSISRAKYTRP